MKKPIKYNLTPARGQALLNFQGRIFPDAEMELFEVEKVEEINQKEDKPLKTSKKQSEKHPDFKNLLIHGDALSACAYLKSKDIKIDLVYIDPPFASGANYAKDIHLRNQKKDKITGEDTSIGEEILYGDIWQKEDYLNWLYERLLAIREVMSDKASIYVHLDWHIGHYAKTLLDEVFGEENFINEIIWHYRTGNLAEKIFQRKHDTIFLYSVSDEYIFNPQEVKEYYFCLYGPDFKPSFEGRHSGKDDHGEYRISLVDDVWDMSGVFTLSNEHEDYDTQKPETLLKRIIKTSSEEGMLVADFFSGSGTTSKVANDLGMKFVTCDIGINGIQTTRDRLVKAKASFDILKIQDGVRLFRNPDQTQAKIFSLIDGFKTKKDLGLGEFWDGGVVEKNGEYVPVKFIPIHDKLTKQLLDVLLEEIYQLQDVGTAVSTVKLIYAHKDPDIDQSYVNKQIRDSAKTSVGVDLVSLDELLGSKRDVLYMPDNSEVELSRKDSKYQVKIKKYFSPYLKTKIDEFNAKKVNKDQEVKISSTGLELIESVQFDTTLKKNGVWTSNLELEDKAGVKEQIKAEYLLPTNKFRMKIRNIAGDEIVIGSDEINK
ncbi:hypothetical protein A3E13_03030 [Candidatus Woesebacteria bacterium RIFCSPHIGHO2_12_FULL_40_20]|nr:MAG: hypothetical protein A2692_05650 [Candidatus Woesebacteria bacterium RIFCSPHIGHO2_01_FULL_39_95]OGM37178.1 MAG: hypothetical protein A3E13_03030 [Candidatus Woesebacteria bacterium RIFCSPHIGHO2_12_FULL_40_20]